MKLMKHCAQCGELKKRNMMPNYNYYELSEVGENNHCPHHSRVLHDVYVTADGEVHTLDRWDINVFRGIIGDLVGEIDRNRELYTAMEARISSIEAIIDESDLSIDDEEADEEE